MYKEEVHIHKVLMKSDIKFRRFKEGSYECDCVICSKWHCVVHLYDLMEDV